MYYGLFLIYYPVQLSKIIFTFIAIMGFYWFYAINPETTITRKWWGYLWKLSTIPTCIVITAAMLYVMIAFIMHGASHFAFNSFFYRFSFWIGVIGFSLLMAIVKLFQKLFCKK